jgi:hypothetical protein
MEDDGITSCPEFAPKYEFCPDSDWWKEGISYSEVIDRGQGSPSSSSSLLEKEFNERAERWERESSIHSSPGERFFHNDYIRIIGKGERVIPLILKRLERSKKDWLWALEHIVPEDENPAKGVENFRDAVKAWIEWGNAKYSK